MDVRSFFPNWKIVRLVLTDATTWHKIVGFPGLEPGMPYGAATIRSVAAGGAADGSAFQMLFNQTAVPADATKGKLVSGSGQTETLPAGLANCYIKGVGATDEIEVELFF